MQTLAKMLGYGCLGCLFVSLAASLFVVGGIVGAFWYFSHNPDLRLTVSYPIIDERGRAYDVVLDLTSEESLPTGDIENIMQQGEFQGFLQFFVGPSDLKLLGTRISVKMPVEAVVDGLADRMMNEGYIEELLRKDPKEAAERLFGDDAGKTRGQLIETKTVRELERLFGKEYEQVLETLFGRDTYKTMIDICQEEPNKVLSLLKSARRQLVEQQLLSRE